MATHYDLTLLRTEHINNANMLFDLNGVVSRLNNLERFLGQPTLQMDSESPGHFVVMGNSVSTMRDRVDYLRSLLGAQPFPWRHTPNRSSFNAPPSDDRCEIDARQMIELLQAIGRESTGGGAYTVVSYLYRWNRGDAQATYMRNDDAEFSLGSSYGDSIFVGYEKLLQTQGYRVSRFNYSGGRSEINSEYTNSEIYYDWKQTTPGEPVSSPTISITFALIRFVPKSIGSPFEYDAFESANLDAIEMIGQTSKNKINFGGQPWLATGQWVSNKYETKNYMDGTCSLRYGAEPVYPDQIIGSYNPTITSTTESGAMFGAEIETSLAIAQQPAPPATCNRYPPEYSYCLVPGAFQSADRADHVSDQVDNLKAIYSEQENDVPDLPYGVGIIDPIVRGYSEQPVWPEQYRSLVGGASRGGRANITVQDAVTAAYSHTVHINANQFSDGWMVWNEPRLPNGWYESLKA